MQRASSLLLVAALTRREPIRLARVPAPALANANASAGALEAGNYNPVGGLAPTVGESTSVYCSCPSAKCAYVTHVLVDAVEPLDAAPADDPVKVNGTMVGRGDCWIELSISHPTRAGAAGVLNGDNWDLAMVLRPVELALCQALPADVRDKGPVHVSLKAPLPTHAEDREFSAAALALAVYSRLTDRPCDLANVVVTGGLAVQAGGGVILRDTYKLDLKVDNAVKYGFGKLVLPLGLEKDLHETETYKKVLKTKPEFFVLCEDLACLVANALV